MEVNLKHPKISKGKTVILGYFFEAKRKIRMGLEKARGEFISTSVMLSGLQATGQGFIVQLFFHYPLFHSTLCFPIS